MSNTITTLTFTNSNSQLTDVINYINGQKQRHLKKSFREEYLEIIKAYDVEYNERYIFSDLV